MSSRPVTQEPDSEAHLHVYHIRKPYALKHCPQLIHAIRLHLVFMQPRNLACAAPLHLISVLQAEQATQVLCYCNCRVLRGHRGAVLTLFALQGLLVSGGRDNVIRVWVRPCIHPFPTDKMHHFSSNST